MIKHIKCDIFESGADIICHQVNCQGVMGSGVAKQVREKFSTVYEAYKSWCSEYTPKHLLGRAQPVNTNNNTIIVNIFAQENFGYDGKCYTDYNALRNGLKTVCLNFKNKIIALPYLMACHRGGGDWNIVYKIIEEVFAGYDGDVLICEYNGG